MSLYVRHGRRQGTPTAYQGTESEVGTAFVTVGEGYRATMFEQSYEVPRYEVPRYETNPNPHTPSSTYRTRKNIFKNFHGNRYLSRSNVIAYNYFKFSQEQYDNGT